MASQWFNGPQGDRIAVDDTFFPIVISTWFGAASEPVVQGYYAWLTRALRRAMSERVPLINVTDACKAGSPSAAVRRLIAEQTLAWGRAGADRHPVTAYVVVDSAIIRGVLTAIGWLHGNMKTRNVATCAEALQGGIDVLGAAGQPPPRGLDPLRWRRPSPPAVVAR